jgi:hypothetical protein
VRVRQRDLVVVGTLAPHTVGCNVRFDLCVEEPSVMPSATESGAAAGTLFVYSWFAYGSSG